MARGCSGTLGPVREGAGRAAGPPGGVEGQSPSKKPPYKAWGETRYTWGTTPTTYRYTGQREDSYINMYYMGARWYDPALARFTQPDTIVPSPGDPQNLSRFSYARNNSLCYTDPSGHKADPIGDSPGRQHEPPPPPGESRLPDLAPYEEQFGPKDAPYSLQYSQAVLDALMPLGELNQDEMLRLIEAAQIVQQQSAMEEYLDKATSVLTSYSMALEYVSRWGDNRDALCARIEQASLGASAQTGGLPPVSSRSAFAPEDMWQYEYWGDYLRQEGYRSGRPGPTGLWGYVLTP